MAARRYTILFADRTSGVVRRVTISARPAVAVACAMVTLPVLIGIGAAWKAKSDVSGLYANQQALEIENSPDRLSRCSQRSPISAPAPRSIQVSRGRWTSCLRS
jgi:hypothetical protein